MTFFASMRKGAWVLCALMVLIVLTWMAELLHLEFGRPSPEEAIRRAEHQIGTHFDTMQEEMLRRARSMATDPVVMEALTSSGDAAPLIRRLSRELLPERWSVEVYNHSGGLIGWNGVTLPLGEPGSQVVSWDLAADSSWRQALEIWFPVQEGVDHLGHVRMLQLLYEHAPVQNEYFQDYDIGVTWSRIVDMPVHTSFSGSIGGGKPLTARDGTVIGYYHVVHPQPEQLEVDLARLYQDVIAFWSMLFLGTLLWVCWRWYHSGRSWLRLAVFSTFWWIARFLLLYMDAPGRWQTGKAPLSPLFDATHLGSVLGGGLMRTAGDFLVSALFLLVFVLVVLRFACTRYGNLTKPPEVLRELLHSPVYAIRFLGAGMVGLSVVWVLGAVVRNAVLNSTVDYLARDTPISQPIVLAILCALVITALAVILSIVASICFGIGPDRGAPEQRSFVGAALFFPVMIALMIVHHHYLGVEWLVTLAFLVTGIGALFFGVGRSLEWFTFRGVLLASLIVSSLTYSLFFAGLSEQRHRRMEHAAASFDRGYDSSIAFAVRDLLEELRQDSDILGADREVIRLTTPTLLASRGAFDLDLRFIDVGSVDDTVGLGSLLQRADLEGAAVGTSESGQGYAGAAPVLIDSVRTGWLLVEATPHVLPEEATTPLLRSLLSSGYRGQYANFSLASFRNGILDRSVGRSFRHVALGEEVARTLEDGVDTWHTDYHGSRKYETYYLRRGDDQIVGVRARVVAVIDHLYYLLQVIVAGLIVGVPFYIVGLVLRRLIYSDRVKRIRFRDKVLNSLLIMAIALVIPVGIVGVGVITEENTKAMQSWLRNYLLLAEVSLSAEAQGQETLNSVASRIKIDSLAAGVGLDLNLYKAKGLVASSRSQLVEDRLTDVRMPIEAYEALFVEGYKFVAIPQQTGDLRYTSGYHALLDERGQPEYVLSIPTLAEQERIDEERARTLSYLFGAMLALMSLVMFAAAIMARALALPIARLQRGLKAVAKGQFEQRLPVQTKDEVGQLAHTFNEMQQQLAESRRQLANQERQLAWREMARQIAHEIKNPLTPMKLSLQHLQRSYQMRKLGREESFGELFKRITSTLIEEIGSLARIANEFASFARMPERTLERLDLNEVIRESALLMKAEVSAGISLEVNLPDEALTVEADRQELKRIYINLLKNALESMRDHSEGTIEVSSFQEDGVAISTVRDTGCGVPEELEDKIFEPNFSTKTSGTGLGLAIARHSVAVLGGTIGFESKAGGGTEFYLRIPLAG